MTQVSLSPTVVGILFEGSLKRKCHLPTKNFNLDFTFWMRFTDKVKAHLPTHDFFIQVSIQCGWKFIC